MPPLMSTPAVPIAFDTKQVVADEESAPAALTYDQGTSRPALKPNQIGYVDEFSPPGVKRFMAMRSVGPFPDRRDL